MFSRLDRRLWPPADDQITVVERAEERIAKGMIYVRLAMVPIQFVPLLGPLPNPLVALAAAVAATLEAIWLYARVRRTRTLLDTGLIAGDVGFCIALILIGRVAAGTSEQMNRVLPFALVGAGYVGFGFGWSRRGLAAVTALAIAWVSTASTIGPVKLVSDLLGFYVWYLATMLTGREFRDMARATLAAQVETARRRDEIAEQTREADVAREREVTHREIHDHLLPIVDLVAAGNPLEGRLTGMAARAATRARRLIVDGRDAPAPGLEAMLVEVRDTYVEAGLKIVSVVRVVSDPPSEVGEVLAHAAREALCNVLKYAQHTDDVNLYAEATERGVELVIRDRGVGFDPAAVAPGGGFTQTYEAVRRRGGTVEVASTPGDGTKVTIRWRPRS